MPELDISAITVGKLGVLLLAISLHESGHAFVASWLGDDTGKSRGRVTLNPLPHLHPIMSILLPAFLLLTNSHYIFGAGRPVPVSIDKLKHPGRDFALIALAGPAVNIVLALLISGTWIFLIQGDEAILDSDHPVLYWLRFGIRINILLACFNLIPIPPLDGSRLLAFFLPGPIRRAFYSLDVIGFVILVALMFTGVLRTILMATYYPLFNWWYDLCLSWI